MGIFQKHLAAPFKISDLTQLAGQSVRSLNDPGLGTHEWDLDQYDVKPVRL